MKPVFQTLFDDLSGNCLQACVASIFELPLEEVPNFYIAEYWLDAYEEFLLSRFGLQLLALSPAVLDGIWVPNGFHIITGDSPRGNWQHAVVGYRGEIVHDPHPSGGGLLANRWFHVFVSTCEEPGGCHGADHP